jgi:hypothetical protein
VKLDIIGLSGKSGSGKDFVGREILRPAGYHQWAFAWPMKNEAVGIGFSYDEVHNTKPPAVRDWLQNRGTRDGWEKHGRFYWCQIAEAWLRTLHEQWGISKFYFTDVRFLHEAEFIKSLGGKLVRINAGDRPLRLTGEAALHVSETALDDYPGFDALVLNSLDRTAESLEESFRHWGVLPRREAPKYFEVPPMPLNDRRGELWPKLRQG